MKLLEACLNVDKTENNEFKGLDEYEILHKLDLDISYETPFDYESYYSRFKLYFVKKWLCTDTHVGLIAMYLDNVLIGCIDWRARRSDKIFYFVNNKEIKMLRDFFISLIGEKHEPKINTEFFEKEIGEFFQVTYYSQVIKSVAYIKDYSELFGIIITKVDVLLDKKPSDYEKRGFSNSVVIRLYSGEEKEISLDEIYFKYNVIGL